MAEPLVQITNRTGMVVGSAVMLDAFARQLTRNTVYVMLVDARGKYLLQRRSRGVPNYPGYWDASAGGHVDEAETPEAAAYRELAEELGVAGTSLKCRDRFYFEAVGDNRLYRYFAHLYVGEYTGDGKFDLSNLEVAAVKFYSRREITRLDKLTPITRHIVSLI